MCTALWARRDCNSNPTVTPWLFSAYCLEVFPKVLATPDATCRPLNNAAHHPAVLCHLLSHADWNTMNLPSSSSSSWNLPLCCRSSNGGSSIFSFLHLLLFLFVLLI
ncbi:hypothetical protein E2C01_060854 [Portunus trituberculatus]|uniref:Uncharacterized protein n=1 Tax=Portunus trituberculatus TaxID=210409 RepID=A0A5B7H6L6_PORTR|nr:hypothetical protein [Portunus trituberculatus]